MLRGAFLGWCCCWRCECSCEDVFCEKDLGDLEGDRVELPYCYDVLVDGPRGVFW